MKGLIEDEAPIPLRRLKERLDRGLSILETAKEMGISHSTLSRYERNLIKRPYKENLDKMKQWLNAK